MQPTPIDKPKSVLRRLGIALLALLIFASGVSAGQQGILSLPAWRPQPSSVNGQLPASLDYSSVNRVYQSLKANYDGKLSQSQLQDGLKHGLAAATKDPYTVYFTAQEAQKFSSDLNQSFSGIGAQLGQDKDGNIIVISPIKGLPADKAGIRPQDIIAAINGNSTSGISVDEAVNQIRGPKGTKVTLQLVRNRSQALTIEITRDDIKLPSVTTKFLDNNIGYIQISTFAEDTDTAAKNAARDFAAKKVKGVVLDLRNNPGGLLDASVKVSSLWLPAGTNVLQEKRDGRVVVNSYAALGGDVLKGIPTVVLINGGSASASEITAGALRDNQAAYIIGEKSYGKGVVQQLISFNDGSQLKVTIASWYRPNGQNINKKGIEPDQVVKPAEADLAAGKDPQLEAALAHLAR